MCCPSDCPVDDSDSETEGQTELRVDEWLIFQLDKEVRAHHYHSLSAPVILSTQIHLTLDGLETTV